MINVAVIEGRLTKEPEVRVTSTGMSVAKFTVAVDRKNSKESKETDYITCTAFGKSAEFLEKYFHKGDGIGITGHIQTGSYKHKDGYTVYTTDIVAESMSFPVGGKKTEEKPKEAAPEGFERLEDDIPFD